jgi:hypothetical protein
MRPGFSSICISFLSIIPLPPPPRFSTDIWTDSQTGRDTPTSNRAEHKQERRPSFTAEENSAFHLRKNPKFIREHRHLSGKIFNSSSLTIQKSFPPCMHGKIPLLSEEFPFLY